MIPPEIPFTTRNISDRIVEKIKTHRIYSIIFFPPEIMPFMR
jgi:hypothetical protein